MSGRRKRPPRQCRECGWRIRNRSPGLSRYWIECAGLGPAGDQAHGRELDHPGLARIETGGLAINRYGIERNERGGAVVPGHSCPSCAAGVEEECHRGRLRAATARVVAAYSRRRSHRSEECGARRRPCRRTGRSSTTTGRRKSGKTEAERHRQQEDEEFMGLAHSLVRDQHGPLRARLGVCLDQRRRRRSAIVRDVREGRALCGTIWCH